MNTLFVPGRIALFGVFLCLGACAALQTQNRETAAVDRLASLLTGVYNNHAQIWRMRQQDRPAPPPTRVVIDTVSGAGEGERYLQYSRFGPGGMAETPARRARWVLRTGNEPQTVVQSVYRNSNGEWRELGGCRVYWRQTEAGFQGRTRGSGCRFRGRGDGQVVTLQRQLTINASGLTYRQSRSDTEGEPQIEVLQLARLVSYSGWAGVQTKTDESGMWRVDDTVRVHNQGGTAPLAADGQALGYSVRLEQLVWPDSGIPMLRLSVVDAASGEMLAYAWAEPAAERLGLNLGWLQVGLERSN